MLEGKYIRLEKVVSLIEGMHPNGIVVGYILSGWVKEFTIGKQLYMYEIIFGRHVLKSWTSKVIDFDSDTMLLKTENSIYKVEIIEN